MRVGRLGPVRMRIRHPMPLRLHLSMPKESHGTVLHTLHTYKRYSTYKRDIRPYGTPLHNLSTVVQRNKDRPKVGSIIEFMLDGQVRYGMVLSPSTALFNVNYNKLIVLTTDNELVSVSPPHVNFHASEVFEPSYISQMQIIENKFNDAFHPRHAVISDMCAFLHKAEHYRELLSGQFNIVFAQYASQDRINSISPIQVIESMKLSPEILEGITESYNAQSALFLAIHMELSRSCQFISTANINAYRESNLSLGFSNILPQGSEYFVNSHANTAACEKLQEAVKDPHTVKRIDSFLRDLLALQQGTASKDIIELSYFFNIWDGKPFRYVIEAMKFAVVCPNERLLQNLAQLEMLPHASPQHIYSLLLKLQVYDNNTDIFASSNLIGAARLDKLSVSDTSSLARPLEESLPVLHDSFPHLRNRKYYSDHIIYALDIDGRTKCAVSIEKINSRNYTFNVHIADVASHIAPSTELFRALAKYSLIHDGQFDFSEHHTRPFLTVSFTYNTFDSEPFANMGRKVAVSFDKLGPASIKCFTSADIENALSERTIFSPFKLFTAPPAPELEHVTGKDRHNIGLINSLLDRSFKHRNLNGAAVCRTFPQVLDSPASTFIHSLLTFTGQLVSEYATANAIPMISQCQDLIQDIERDAVLISHDNMIFPAYKAHTYAEAVLVKDAAGMVSLPARLAAHNYLGPPELKVDMGSNTTYGTGFVDIVPKSFASLLNQLQLLNHVQANHNEAFLANQGSDQLQLVHRYGYLKRLGYNLNGPLSTEVMAQQLPKVAAAEQLHRWVSRMNKRFRTLTSLKNNPIGPWRCVITHNTPAFHGNESVLGFCVELGLEVQVVADEMVEIGQTVVCDKLLSVDVVSGVAVLGREDVL